MKITEVRIFPTESKDGKLKAFATMTFDDWFVVRNVKIIQGNNGLFVAMPSRKAMDSCPRCSFKNVRGSKFCNQCGSKLPDTQVQEETSDRQGNHMDIAHPITQECRMYIQEQILKAYGGETERAQKETRGAEPTTPSGTGPAEVSGDVPGRGDVAADEGSGISDIEGTRDIEL